MCFALLMHQTPLLIEHKSALFSPPQYSYSYLCHPGILSCLVFLADYGAFVTHCTTAYVTTSKFKYLGSDSVKHFSLIQNVPFPVWLQFTRSLTFRFRNSKSCKKQTNKRMLKDLTQAFFFFLKSRT